MTRLAAFETGEGRKSMAIGSYFRSDYIAREVIKSIIYVTMAYGIVIVGYVAYDFEEFMANIYNIDLLQLGKTLLYRYLAVVGIYALVTYIIYSFRYRKARKNLRIYYNNLRRLNSMYKKEASSQSEDS